MGSFLLFFYPTDLFLMYKLLQACHIGIINSRSVIEMTFAEPIFALELETIFRIKAKYSERSRICIFFIFTKGVF